MHPPQSPIVAARCPETQRPARWSQRGPAPPATPGTAMREDGRSRPTVGFTEIPEMFLAQPSAAPADGSLPILQLKGDPTWRCSLLLLPAVFPRPVRGDPGAGRLCPHGSWGFWEYLSDARRRLCRLRASTPSVPAAAAAPASPLHGGQRKCLVVTGRAAWDDLGSRRGGRRDDRDLLLPQGAGTGVGGGGPSKWTCPLGYRRLRGREARRPGPEGAAGNRVMFLAESRARAAVAGGGRASPA